MPSSLMPYGTEYVDPGRLMSVIVYAAGTGAAIPGDSVATGMTTTAVAAAAAIRVRIRRGRTSTRARIHVHLHFPREVKRALSDNPCQWPHRPHPAPPVRRWAPPAGANTSEPFTTTST